MEEVVDAFSERVRTVEIGDEVSTKQLAASVEKIPPLKQAAVKLCANAQQPTDDPAYLAAAAELLLDALYVNNRLSKYAFHGKTFFKR